MYAEWWRNAALYELQQEEQAKHPNAFVFLDAHGIVLLWGEKAEEWAVIGKKYGKRAARPYCPEIGSNGERVCAILVGEVWLNKTIKTIMDDGIKIVVIPYTSQMRERIENRAQEIFNEEILRRINA